MLPKSHRLSRPEFKLVRKSGYKAHNSSYLVYHAPGSSLKVSVVVSNKISKRAVVRNNLRRKIYNHLYLHYPKLARQLIIYLQKYEINFSELDQILSALS